MNNDTIDKIYIFKEVLNIVYMVVNSILKLHWHMKCMLIIWLRIKHMTGNIFKNL